MEIKHNKMLGVAAVSAVAGLLLGWFIWVPTSCCGNKKIGMHQMADGRMMQDRDMGSMQAMMSDMSLSLKEKTGDAFDKSFLEEMIVHHQGAIDMAMLVLESSNRPELKKLAQEIITAQTVEIQMMKSWQQTWFR